MEVKGFANRSEELGAVLAQGLSPCWTGTMFVFGTFGTCGTFGPWLAPDCSEHLTNVDQHQSKICQNQPKTPKVNMLKSWDVSFAFEFEWRHQTQQQDM